MVRKGLLVLVIGTIILTGAFAEVFIGAGLYFANDFGGGAVASYGNNEVKVQMPNTGFGTYAFVDVEYLELSLGLFWARGEMSTKASSGGLTIMDETMGTLSFSSVYLGLLGKYPIPITNFITVFPLFGMEYNLVTSGKMKEDGVSYDLSDATDLSALWFKAGAGMDYSINGDIFLRITALYGVRLANKAEKDTVDGLAYQFGSGFDIKTRLGHGLTIKAAIGF